MNKHTPPLLNFKNIILVILTLLIFSGIFSLKYLVQLDSVYFFKEAYSDLTSKLSMWSSYDAPFGGVHMILWLYPVTYLAGLIGQTFNLDWNILVRIFFYIPSIILSFYSIQRLGDYFKFSSKGKFLMSLIYVFNTYFIMLVDGGQLGVMLAYSIFPLAVESILNTSFFRTTFTLALISVFDPRFFLISLLTGLLLDRFNLKKYFKLVPILLFVLLISSYWIIPILKVGSVGVTTFVSDLKLTSFVNALFLYQPHWPLNEFGKVSYPNILFLAIPFILVLATLIKPTKQKAYWMILFVFFAFLIKGETNPLGSIYSYFLNSFSIATVFRDSTKFFAPLLIIYSLIVSKFYDGLKSKYLMLIIPVLFLIPLIPGLIFGGNNNLKGTFDVDNLLTLKSNLKNDNSFSRTVYIPQKPQLAFQTENSQAIDGRVLVNYLPFASDNYGSEDRFNFMLRDNYLNYFRSLGIRNAILISDQKPEIATIENPMPEKYYIDKLAVVVGSPIGAEKLVPEYGVAFIEDGKASLEAMLKIPSNNMFFYLNSKTKNDLIMSGLKEYFVDPSHLKTSNWAKYSGDDYLTWKYQLLIREVDTKDINYGGGIVMSTVKDEIVKIDTNIKPNTKYKIFVRGLSGKDSNGILINDTSFNIPSKNVFSWVEKDFKSDSQLDELIITNNGGFNVIGQVIIIEDEEYQEYLSDISQKLRGYQILDSRSKLPQSKISFEPKEGIFVFNQSYHQNWRLGDKLPFPINSITNGYFVSNSDLSLSPYFLGQETLDLGINISLASVSLLFVSYFGYAVYGFVKKHKKSN